MFYFILADSQDHEEDKNDLFHTIHLIPLIPRDRGPIPGLIPTYSGIFK